MKNHTDYQKFVAAAAELGAQRIHYLGKHPGYPTEDLEVESWYFNPPARCAGEGFFLVHNRITGKIGIYEFVGNSGDKIETDLQWLMRKYSQIRDGKGGQNGKEEGDAKD